MLIVQEPTKGFLPNAIIAGAPKAGTSSVHRWIAAHPDALGSIEKETYYFVDPGTHMYRPSAHILNGLDGYRGYFPAPRGVQPQVVIESTPSYLYSQTALRELTSLPTRPKFAFLLREPVEQIYSAFKYFKNNWNWIPHEMDFASYLREVESGRASFNGNELAENAIECAEYVKFLIDWRRAVGYERMHIWTFEDLKNNKLKLVKEMARFFGLSDEFYDHFDFPASNVTYEPRSRVLQRINIAVRKRLPPGDFYDSVRSVYRRLNTKAPSHASRAERNAMRRLRPHFARANARLSEEFGLDLSSWV